MSKKIDTVRMFSRRSFMLGALQLSALAVLGGRMAWLQIAHGPRYRMLSDKNRINIKLLAPSRGVIVDRFGKKLAVNTQSFQAHIIPEQAGNLETALKNVQRHIRLEAAQIENIIEKAGKQPGFVPLEIRDDLTWEEVSRLEVHLPELPGLSIKEGEVRSYPYGESTAHVIGYVGAVTKADIQKDDPIFKLPGLKVGKTGIEKTYEQQLRGGVGTSEVEVNVVGREVRELSRRPGNQGAQVVLTIDGELQQYVQDRLAQERSASAVIMDVHTGAVYAMASQPSFDPNLFTHGLSAAKWEELLADPAYPLTNKAVAGQYPPASTFKMITAMAGLKTGLIDAQTRVFCPGHYDFGGDRFHCWKRGGHGWVDLTDSLKESCDVYFYDLATKVGIDEIAKTARAFGFGSKLGFELREERPGLVPDKNWKMGHFGESWKKGESVVASIGQGYLQATPLQMAVMTARLVNGGKAVKPWLTAYSDARPFFDRAWPDLGFDARHLSLVAHGMDEAVNHEKGTAFGARIQDPRMAMGGKTGTAQVRKITMQQRAEGIRMEDLPWRHRHHGLFVGYAPLNKPRYACAVVVEHGIGGSVSAAPIARDILLQAQKRNPAAHNPDFQNSATLGTASGRRAG